MIGGAILRYAMGLIVWTIIAVAFSLKDMFTRSEDNQEKMMIYIVLFLFVLRAIVQFTLNFVRISSQGG